MRLDEDGLRGILADADGVLTTDGAGHVTSTHGEIGEAAEWAPSLDLTLSAIQTLGARQATGELEVAMLTYKNRTVVMASTPGGDHVAVVAKATVKPGLLLSHVKRLVGSDESRGGARP